MLLSNENNPSRVRDSNIIVINDTFYFSSNASSAQAHTGMWTFLGVNQDKSG